MDAPGVGALERLAGTSDIRLSARARPHTVESFDRVGNSLHASKSPVLAMGNRPRSHRRASSPAPWRCGSFRPWSSMRGALLTVAQRGVENDQSVLRHVRSSQKSAHFRGDSSMKDSCRAVRNGRTKSLPLTPTLPDGGEGADETDPMQQRAAKLLSLCSRERARVRGMRSPAPPIRSRRGRGSRSDETMQ